MLERIAAIAETNGYNLRSPLILVQNATPQVNPSTVYNGSNGTKVPPPRPAPPPQDPIRAPPTVCMKIV